MSEGKTGRETESDSSDALRWAVVAWVLTSVYYFYQYALRSAPAVMMPELSDGFGIRPTAVAAMVAVFYYGYSPFSLVAGVAMDRIGPRRLLPGAAAVLALGDDRVHVARSKCGNGTDQKADDEKWKRGRPADATHGLN